jgi:ABC-type tungstate transport system substrate-binding protein
VNADALGALALAILSIAVIAAVILGLIALWIYICVYVYRDAKRRGMDATVWLLLVLLTGFIGLIVYLIVRRDHPIQPPPPPPQRY